MQDWWGGDLLRPWRMEAITEAHNDKHNDAGWILAAERAARTVGGGERREESSGGSDKEYNSGRMEARRRAVEKVWAVWSDTN